MRLINKLKYLNLAQVKCVNSVLIIHLRHIFYFIIVCCGYNIKKVPQHTNGEVELIFIFFLYYFHAKKIRRDEFDISVIAYYYYYYYYYLEINTYKVHYKLQSKTKSELWVPVSSTGKISDACIRDLGFNPRLHQKLIGVLV